MVLYNIPTHVTGDTLNEIRFSMIHKATNTPIDLTGTSIAMSVYEYGIDPPLTIPISQSFTTGNSKLTITDATHGKFQINTQVVSIPDGRYNYEIVFTFPGSIIKTYIRGTWRIIA